MRRMTSTPSISGRMMSRIITSGLAWPILRRASMPFVAVSTATSGNFSRIFRLSIFSVDEESSTTSTRAPLDSPSPGGRGYLCSLPNSAISLRRTRRWPPGVRYDRRIPESIQRWTVVGATLNSLAASFVPINDLSCSSPCVTLNPHSRTFVDLVVFSSLHSLRVVRAKPFPNRTPSKESAYFVQYQKPDDAGPKGPSTRDCSAPDGFVTGIVLLG